MMTDEHAVNEAASWSSEVPDLPGERRYRGSRYFQEDRLRCSDAADELRQVKSILSTWSVDSVFAVSNKLVWQPAVVVSASYKK